jgi:hypothetical protein
MPLPPLSRAAQDTATAARRHCFASLLFAAADAAGAMTPAPLRRFAAATPVFLHLIIFFISPPPFYFRHAAWFHYVSPRFSFSPAIRHAEPPMPSPPFIFTIHAMP